MAWLEMLGPQQEFLIMICCEERKVSRWSFQALVLGHTLGPPPMVAIASHSLVHGAAVKNVNSEPSQIVRDFENVDPLCPNHQ